MDFDPKSFDKYREENCLEAKAANGGLPGSLWDTYSSFANSYGTAQTGGCHIVLWLLQMRMMKKFFMKQAI